MNETSTLLRILGERLSEKDLTCLLPDPSPIAEELYSPILERVLSRLSLAGSTGAERAPLDRFERAAD